MRHLVGRIGITIAASVLVAVGMSAPAHAATASPANLDVDCSGSPAAATTFTGAIGDTFSIANVTSMGSGCVFQGEPGIVSIAGLDPRGEIAMGTSATLTIISAGTFDLCFWGACGGPAATAITVSIGEGGGGGVAGGGDGHVDGVGEPRPQDVPNQAGGVTATGGLFSAVVSWATPTQSGPQAVTLYEVTSAPDGRTCVASAPATSCAVNRLRPGTSYTFTVKAFSPIGWGPASAPSNAVVPTGVAPGAPRGAFADVVGSVLQVDWTGAESPSGEPVTYEVQSARCPEPCASLDGLVFNKDLVSHEGDDEFAGVFTVGMSAPVVVRIRTVDFAGATSEWVYTAAVAPLKKVSSVKAFSDALGSFVQWSGEADGALPAGMAKSTAGYEVQASTKGLMGDSATPLRAVGTTTRNSTSVPLQGGTSSLVQFGVRPIPSFLYTLANPGAASPEATVAPWRRQVNLVPTPKIIDATFGPNAADITMNWEAGEGTGAINVIGYLIETRDSATREWSYGAVVGDPGKTSFAFNALPETTKRVNGVRIRAVAWPGKHSSAWALAVS